MQTGDEGGHTRVEYGSLSSVSESRKEADIEKFR
jgi:hypothetical protein